MDLRTRTVRVSERCAHAAAAAAFSSPDEGLERSALRVDAQRHALPLLVLRDEPMDQLCGGDRTTDQRRSRDGRLVTGAAATFALPHRQQAVLVAVAEGPLRHRLKVAGVDPAAGDGVAALTHAGVVAQATFVQVRVGQRVAARDPLGLDGKTGRQHAAPVSPRQAPIKGNSPDQRPACGRAGAPPRAWRRRTACRAPTARAEKPTNRHRARHTSRKHGAKTHTFRFQMV